MYYRQYLYLYYNIYIYNFYFYLLIYFNSFIQILPQLYH